MNSLLRPNTPAPATAPCANPKSSRLTSKSPRRLARALGSVPVGHRWSRPGFSFQYEVSADRSPLSHAVVSAIELATPDGLSTVKRMSVSCLRACRSASLSPRFSLRAQMAPLVATTGVPLDDYIGSALRDGGLAGALRAGLRDGHRALAEDVASAASRARDDARPVFMRTALPLVAEHQDKGILATLLAYPPIYVIYRYYTAAAEIGSDEAFKAALVGSVSLIKIKAVAVADGARGHGLGSALLQRCEQVYRQCEFSLLYGQIPPGRHPGDLLLPLGIRD